MRVAPNATMPTSRRAILSSAAAAGAVGAAGCLGGSDDGPSEYDCDTAQPEPVSELPQPVAGDPEADVVVAAFEDFGCPHCATWALEEYPTIESEYVDPGEIRFEHWDFTIPVTDWSAPVANAGRGVQERAGDDAFFAFAKRAYELQGDHSLDAVGTAAEAADADPCAAIADAESEPYEAVLSGNRSEGEERGVSGTPTVFVNGESVEPTADAVSEAIENAL